MDITIKDAYQVVEKVVSVGGNSGRVYVPREWIGKRVKIVLIDSLDQIKEDDTHGR
jgi:putative transposon-encoded protein